MKFGFEIFLNELALAGDKGDIEKEKNIFHKYDIIHGLKPSIELFKMENERTVEICGVIYFR